MHTHKRIQQHYHRIRYDKKISELWKNNCTRSRLLLDILESLDTDSALLRYCPKPNEANTVWLKCFICPKRFVSAGACFSYGKALGKNHWYSEYAQLKCGTLKPWLGIDEFNLFF